MNTMYRVRSLINDTWQNVYIYLCNKDREQCLVSFQSFTNRLSAYTTLRYIQQEPKTSETQKDGRAFGFRARKEYSEIFEFCNIAVGIRKVFQMK